MPGEVRLHPLKPLLGEPHARPVLDGEVPAEPAPELEADRIAGHRGRPNDPDQELDRERPLPGEDAAEDDRELARGDEAQEGRGLGQRQGRDQQVGPLAEAFREVLDQVLDHGSAQFRT